MCSDRIPTAAAVNDAASPLCALVYDVVHTLTQNKILREKAAQDDRNTELFSLLRDGSTALLDERVVNALMFYGKCVDLIQKYGLTVGGSSLVLAVSIDKLVRVNALHNVYCIHVRVPIAVGCLLQYLDQFKEVDQVVMKYALGDACVRVATNKVQSGPAYCTQMSSLLREFLAGSSRTCSAKIRVLSRIFRSN